ncbi:protein of unknown function DUF214 [Cellulomonas flavigena DSM 20109]|uniref:ABC3 transporter permease C-terminal domain-containing protein n=1 Tax=Cellulomonas flavigena (strain ATCC 482 / DSM 20109 / BCRC 11376 / JCM 18109 / NBRC 3775 / NCIMB 8073 / NRS 134) TaxID=446466 RepID=D5UHG2_CELFN|nr:FtsX-like permease family protein [Cellulomonas flavigena]ADG75283.1 protein of unknown function DUF214 [Cellulomonas flavigena DSM 20109]
MLRLTLAQMRRSLARLVAAGVAILLGSAFVTATLTAGDVITRGGYDAITASYGSADLVVGPVEENLADVLDTARRAPGVVATDPFIAGWASFQSGRRTLNQTIVPVPSDPGLASLEVVAGRAPTTPTEVALPDRAAERLGIGVGDVLTTTWWVWSDEPAPAAEPTGPSSDEAAGDVEDVPVAEESSATEVTGEVTVVGLVSDPHGAWARFGGAGTAVTEAVVTWTGAETLDEVYGARVLVATDGSPAAARAALTDALPGIDVRTRDEAAAASVEQYGAGNVVVLMVLGFAAVSLLVAALVIANTFQVIVAQRTRMLALLRCVGARRGQLRTSVLLEAAILGAVAGVAGVAVGLALAQGALSVLNRVQDGVPLPPFVQPTPGNVLVPVLVSVVVTVGAALVPAHAATRVSPVAALRPADAPTVRARPGRVRLAISLLLSVGGTAVLLGGVAMARSDLAVDEMLNLLVGVLGGSASFVGLLVGAPLWLPHVVSAVGRPVSSISTSARLAAANTLRNPRRTSATSAALVIGVTLVVMMSTGALSAERTMARQMDEEGPVDLVVVTGSGAAVSASVRGRVADVDGVADVVATRTATVTAADGGDLSVVVVDAQDVHVLRDAASAEALAEGRSVLPRWWARDATSLVAEGERTATIDVLPRNTDTALLASPAAQALGVADGDPDALLVRLEDGTDAATAILDVQQAVQDDDMQVESSAAKRQSDERVIEVVLAIVIGLLGVAVLIALIGVANTLSLSVIERRRESATLRAVGLSRRGLQAMLATEGMLIAGVGALVGTALGLLYGWAGASTVLGPLGDVRLSVPWAHVGVVLVVALLAGLVASALPARAAARTPPVAALGVD